MPDPSGPKCCTLITQGRSTAPHENIEKTNEYLGKMLDSPCNGKLDFVLVLRSTRNVIGKLGIWRADPTNPEVGFMLARAYWGKGYMAEAMEAWLEYLWGPDCERLVRGEQEKEFGKPADRTQKGGIQAYAGARVEKVVADVDPRNDACLGMMKKFDFVETGREERTYETHLGWCDSVYLELRRPKRA